MNFAQTIYHGETHLLMQYVPAWPKNSYIGQRPGSCTSGPFPVWHIDDQHLVRGELTHRSSKGRVQRYGADETVVAYDRQTRAGMGDRGFVLTWPPHLGTPNDQCKTNAISQSFAYGPEVCRSEPELHSHGWMCPSLTDSRCLPTLIFSHEHLKFHQWFMPSIKLFTNTGTNQQRPSVGSVLVRF